MTKDQGPRILCLALLAFSAWCLSLVAPIMRESDQASLTLGVLALIEGESPRGLVAYNYDHTYLSYLYLAAFSSPFLPDPATSPVDPARLVFLTNLATCLAFLAGLWPFALAARHHPRRWHCLALVACLASPALLLSIPLLSSNIISAGALLALAALLQSPADSWRRRLAASLLAFVALGMRADAALLMPALCAWTAPRPGWLALVTTPRHYFLAAGAIASLALGTYLTGDPAQVAYGAFFKPKIFAAYLIFGALPTLLVFLVLAAQALRAPQLGGILYRAALPALLLLPLALYAWQLFTPRHLILIVLGTLIAALSPRALALPILRKPRPTPTIIAAPIFAAALLPLVLGLHLPSPSRPGPTLAHPTLYPTTDGFWPMGAYLAFSRQLARPTQPADHNQALWLAAIAAPWHSSSHHTLFPSYLYPYAALSCRAAGSSYDLHPGPGWPRDATVIIDARALRKAPVIHSQGVIDTYANLLLDHHHSIFSSAAGQVLLAFTIGQPATGPIPSLLPRHLLGGDDYDWLEALPVPIPIARHHEGRAHLLLSSAPFTIPSPIPGHPDLASTPVPEATSWHQAKLPDAWVRGGHILRARSSAPLHLARSSLPTYMSLGQF
jgi:hypothetical protein